MGDIGHFQAKIVDPHRGAVGALHRVGAFVLHAHAHILQHRQAGRQADRLAGAEHFQVLPGAALAQRLVQLERQRRASQRFFDQADVQHGVARRKIFAVGHREGMLVLRIQGVAARLAMAVDQLLAQLVAPAAHNAGDVLLDAQRVKRRQRARGADDVVHAGQMGVRNRHAVFGGAAVQRLHQDFFDFQPHFGAEAVARHKHQRADIALIQVGAQEQAHARALQQIDQAFGNRLQDVHRDFKQLVARVAFQHKLQGFFFVAVFDVITLRHHRVHLAAQNRDIARRFVVGGSGVQAQKTAFANHMALGVVALDANKIQMRRAVDGRAGLRFVQHDRAGRVVSQLAQVRRQHGKAGRIGLVALIAQNAVAAARHNAQRVAVVGAHQVVGAVAQQQEVAGVHPVQKRGNLVHVQLAIRQRRLLQFSLNVLQLAAHGRLVFHRQADVVQHLLQFGHHRRQLGGVADAVDLQMNQRFQRQIALAGATGVQQAAVGVAFDFQHRMHQQMQGEVVAGQQHGHRINQERHVVVDDFDGGVGGLPTVALKIRVVGAHLVLAGQAFAGKVQVGHGGAVEVERRGALEVGRLGFFKIGGEIRGKPGVVGGGQTLGGNRGDIGNQRVQFNLAGQGHVLGSFQC